MTPLKEKTAAFRALHSSRAPFIIPNPCDAGSARMLEGLGFPALATTSSGFAMTLGRKDYGVTREQAIAHGADISDAVDIPVNADLENGFGPAPEDAAKTIALACKTSLAGGSIEDSTCEKASPVITDDALAIDRVAAAAQAVKDSGRDFVLTARAEAFLYGIGDLGKVIARLNAFADAGADVLYPPGLPDMDTVRAICANVSKPVNILILGALAKHSVAEFAEAGAVRLSLGGGLAWNAYGTLGAATEMLSAGRFDMLAANRDGAKKIGRFLKG